MERPMYSVPSIPVIWRGINSCESMGFGGDSTIGSTAPAEATMAATAKTVKSSHCRPVPNIVSVVAIFGYVLTRGDWIHRVVLRNTDVFAMTGAIGLASRIATLFGTMCWTTTTSAGIRIMLRLIQSIRLSRQPTRLFIPPANYKSVITASANLDALHPRARR